MADLTLPVNAIIGGVQVQGVISESGGGQIGEEFTAPMAAAGALTTRTDSDTGVVTLSTGHGVQSADIVDVFWSGGRRHGMTATVNGNAVSLDGGAGDSLPAATTAVTVAQRVDASFSFEGDDAQFVLIASDKRASVVLKDANGTVLAIDLLPGRAWPWATSFGSTNPLAGKSIVGAWIGCGDATAAAAVKVGVIHDNTN